MKHPACCTENLVRIYGATFPLFAIAFLMSATVRLACGSTIFLAHSSAIPFEAANPRHADEWTVFERVKLPEGKVLIPGVLESKTNFVAHPDLIAQWIARYAKLVGRENVIAGSDCGYGNWVGQAAFDPDVVWAKLAAMAEGTRIATREFWKEP